MNEDFGHSKKISEKNSKFILPKKFDKTKPSILIYNPIAGTRTNVLDKIKNGFKKRNIKCEEFLTTGY